MHKVNSWFREIKGFELRACPCGGRAVLYEMNVPDPEGNTVNVYQIECDKCRDVLGQGLAYPDLIHAWNEK